MKIVAAQYRENMSWTKDLNVDIVKKDYDLPNFGREPASFIWYIIQHWNDLEGEYMFVQGNPFDHAPTCLNEILPRGQAFKWLGDTNYSSDQMGRPHDTKPVGVVAEELGLKVEWPVYFARGGQFIVTAKRIKERPIAFYEQCFAILHRHNDNCYAFERLWGVIFGQ